MYIKHLLLVSAITVILSQCSGKLDDSALLPPATGDPGEVVLVMDSIKWAGPLGQELRDIYRAPHPGLLQDEPLFHLIHVVPDKFNRVLKNAKNLIFVHTFEGNSRSDRILEQYFTEASRTRIKSDPDLFMVTQEDLFAKDQSVLYLFQVNTDDLINHLQNHRNQLLQHFLEVEKARFSQALYKAPSVEGIENHLIDKYQCYLKVPFGYEIAVETDQVIWLRQRAKIDKNIFITYRDYNDESELTKAQIVNFRDRRWRRFLLGQDSLSYMITEPLVPVDSTAVNLDRNYAIEIRGIWKLNNNSMGGSFISYSVVDQSLGRIYYLEGFVYAPGENKRNPLRELETILWTFKTRAELGS